MSQHTYNKILKGMGIAVIVIGVFVLGAYAGTKKSVAQFLAPRQAQLADISYENIEGTDLSEFWYVWNLMKAKFPFADHEPTSKDKVYGAISGLVASYGDPYTTYMPPQEAKLFNEQVKGSFGGVGIEIGLRNNFLTVIAPTKDSPAEKAGIMAGDVIAKVNGKATDGMTVDSAVSLIRGDIGTPVELTIARKGAAELQTFSIVRDVVRLPVIDTEEQGDVFVIKLYSFTENSAQLFTDALKKFNASGKEKLVIDLRNNPGGYLEASVDIASYFLPAGKTIVKEDSGKGDSEIIHQSKGYTLLPRVPKTVILINEGSASASEILAGALSEHGVATIVGKTSFGKGSVQEVVDLPDKSSVKITIAKWFTPKGVSISDKGITPSTVVEEKPVLDKKTNTYNDPDMEAALKILK